MTQQITVYTKPDCGQCFSTYTVLTKKNIDFDLVDISKDDVALERVKDLGYLQAPVVVTPDEHWSGFRPDKIDQLAKRLQEM